jgi:tetratricopeptide (TPR) repeat protein
LWLLGLQLTVGGGVVWAAPTEDEADAPLAEGATGGDDAQDSEVREIEALDQATLDQAEALFFSGLQHYRKGRFEHAAVEFQKAYTLTRHRDLIYNIARSREQLGDRPGAVEWYRAYLATGPTDETAIIHRIKELGGDPTPAVGKTGVAAAPRGTKAAEGAETSPVEEVGAGIWPWVSLGAGVAAVGLGTVFGLKALDSAASARDATVRSKAQGFKSDAESQAVVADVAFAVGAVGLAGAAVLWFLADNRAETDGQVQVGLTPGGAAIGFTGTF